MPLPNTLLAKEQPETDNWNVVQGDTFRREYQLLDETGAPIDLTGVTPTAKIRATFNGGTLLATPICTIPTPTNGTVVITIPAATTAGLSAGTADLTRQLLIGAWDLELNEGSSDCTPVMGEVYLVRRAN